MMKGFILAAGFGSRMRPYTDYLPKPLFPFFGVPILDLAFWQIRNALPSIELGCNAHHLHEKIKAHLASSSRTFYQDTYLSIESPQILGTGGAFFPIREWRQGADLLVYNGDIISDLNFRAMKHHFTTQNLDACLAVLPRAASSDRSIFVTDNNVITISKDPPAHRHDAVAYSFACAHIMSSNFIATFLEKEPVFDVMNAYNNAISAGARIGIYEHNGYWHDLGTFARAIDAHCDALHRDPVFFQHSGLDALLRQCGYDYVVDRDTNKKQNVFYKTAKLKELYQKTLISEDAVLLSCPSYFRAKTISRALVIPSPNGTPRGDCPENLRNDIYW